MSGLRATPVEIHGRVYQIKTKDDDAYVENLVRMVLEKSREVASATKTVDSLRLADMTALALADAYCTLKDEHDRLQQSWREEQQRCVAMIDKTLAEHKDSLPDS